MEKLYLYEDTEDGVFEKIEKQFNTMMDALDLQGYCHIKYEEEHPEHANHSGLVTCDGGMLNEGFYWTMQYRPESQTAKGFVNAVKARLFDMIADATDTAEIANNWRR